MQKKIKIKTVTFLTGGFISIGLLVFTLVFFELLRIQINKSMDITALIEKFSIPVAFIYIFFAVFHLAAIISIFIDLKFFKRDNFFRSFVFYLSFISIMMLFGDFALVGDIVKEYEANLISGINAEFLILYISQIIHFVFFILFSTLIFYSLKIYSKNYLNKEALKDEAVFINCQYIGLLSGLSGLLVFIFTILFTPLWAIKKGIIILSIFSLIPYMIIIIYWIILKFRERLSEYCDEKQYHDILKAAFFSIMISTFFLFAAFMFQMFNKSAYPYISLMWFPFYLFFLLFLFSGFTLYFNKKT